MHRYSGSFKVRCATSNGDGGYRRMSFMKYGFLVETYEPERIKVVSVWSEFRDEELFFRPREGDPRGRSFHEQMLHQCISEDISFRTMLGIDVSAPPLPKPETRLDLIRPMANDATGDRPAGWVFCRSTEPPRCTSGIKTSL